MGTAEGVAWQYVYFPTHPARPLAPNKSVSLGMPQCSQIRSLDAKKGHALAGMFASSIFDQRLIILKLPMAE
jgi:hypothetical protein